MATNEELTPGISAIDASNVRLKDMLDGLRDKDSFRLYSCDMLGSCEYMPQELFECYSESCEIYPVDDEEIPETIKAADSHEHDFDLDGWARWDMPSDDYYSTTQFPEEFTGYDGSEVWQFIHSRICFNEVSEDNINDAENWKTDFNKAVSGLHSMISAHIVLGIRQKLNAGEDLSEEQWTDPVVEFQRRLSPQGETPHAIENMYFTYMLILKAVSKARERLIKDCESGKIDDDAATLLKPVLSFPLLEDDSIGVASVKLHDHAVKNASDLWEARMRMRELMRIMNCVQCNKCRLHGKIAVLGLSTAMQILLGRVGEGVEDIGSVHRVELAALMTVMSKFSTAVQLCAEMQSLCGNE